MSSIELKIAKNNLGIDNQGTTLSTENQQYEWRKIVGSIRRRVQRNVTSQAEAPESVQSDQPIRRKSSLTASKLDFLRREKSKDETTSSFEKKDMTLSKQKSVGFEFDPQKNRPNKEPISTKTDVNIRIDKYISSSKNSDSSSKGVRKSELNITNKTKDNPKVQKSNFSFKSSKSGAKNTDSKKTRQEKNRDDFLKATMRIFLVVSPPVGKMQVIYKIIINFFLLFLLLIYILLTLLFFNIIKQY